MVDGVNSTTNSTSTSTSSSSELGKDDFLKLMIAQLKNQDPLNPLDGSEYAAQLAQFSSLEQLTNLNDYMKQSIDASLLLTQSVSNTMATNYIGKEVKLSGEDLTLTGQDSITLGYNMPSAPKTAKINIYDSNGTLVKTISDIPTSVGDNKLSWDLTDNSGNKLKDGDYTFEVEATTVSGEDMTVDVFKYGVIDGIRFTDNGTEFLIDGAGYSVADVLEITTNNDGGDN
ncbi:MAG: flagellar hook capping protein [Ignavibacteriales bacterium]|nr:flagellar hook capping protein [Ignavibacteriales bacterium]